MAFEKEELEEIPLKLRKNQTPILKKIIEKFLK